MQIYIQLIIENNYIVNIKLSIGSVLSFISTAQVDNAASLCSSSDLKYVSSE